MIHREVADQPGVGIVLVVGHHLPHGRQVKDVPLRGGPHPLQHIIIVVIMGSDSAVGAAAADPAHLVRLVDDHGVVGQRLHNAEVLDRGCRESLKVSVRL